MLRRSMANAGGIRQVMNARHGWRAGCPLQGRITQGRCSKRVMDMTLDGWVFIRVARQCLSKIKGYPYEVDSGDDTLLNARCKKGLPKWIALFLRMGAWRCSTLTWGDPTLPSTLTCFTSEFGMDSGGTTSLLPPGINFL